MKKPPPDDPVQVMADAMRLSEGPAVQECARMQVGMESFRLWDGELGVRTETAAWHYAPGSGLIRESKSRANPAQLRILEEGAVRAGVAALNGLVPVHASCIALDGKAIAFTGPSGSGKSTIAASLVAQGAPLVAEDTLVLADAGPHYVALPSSGPLKLKPSAEQAFSDRLGAVAGETDTKRLFEVPHPPMIGALPLAGILALASGPGFALQQMSGGEAIALFDDDHYTAEMVRYARNETPPARFARLADMASRIPVFRFARPDDLARLPAAIDFLRAEFQ